MEDYQNNNYRETMKLIYHDLPILLQNILCSSYKCVGYDGLEEDFEYTKKYIDEARKVANLTLDGQLATLKNIISKN